MKNAEYVKTVKDVGCFRLKDSKSFSRELIREAFAACDAKSLVFDLKPFAPRKGYIDMKMDKGLSLRLGYYAARKDIRIPSGYKAMPGLELREVTGKDFPEFRKYTDRMIELHYRRPIKDHISRQFTKSCRDFSSKVLRKCDNARLFVNGEQGGAVSCIDWKLQGGRLGTLVAWVYIDSKLPAKVRESAKWLMTKWLLAHGRGRFGSAEHAKSHATQKFFNSIGFRPERFIVERI